MINEFGQTPKQLFFKKSHPERLKKSEIVGDIFKAKAIKYYGRTHLTNNDNIGISKMCWTLLKDNKNNTNIVYVTSDCTFNLCEWIQSDLKIKKLKNKFASKGIFNKFGNKKKKTNKIGTSFSTKIFNRNQCFDVTKNGRYIFGAGFEDSSFVVYDCNLGKVIQGIIKHSDIVSCLSLDENISRNKAILVTGSFDCSVMVWRLNMNTDDESDLSNSTLSLRHRRSASSINEANNRFIDEIQIIEVEPIFIFEDNMAPIMSVCCSLKSGIIACCSKGGIINTYNSSTGEHLSMLQPFIDRFKLITHEQNETKTNNTDIIKPIINNNNSLQDIDIKDGELNMIKVSHTFGRLICYSSDKRLIFLYSSNGKLLNYYNTKDDIFYDIKFSKNGNHIVCGGKNKCIRIYDLPSFKAKKKLKEPKSVIRNIVLDKDETYMLVGLANGYILVYSLPEKAFVKSRVQTLTDLGF